MLLILENITFTWEDLLTNTKKSRRREPGPEMREAAERAYKKGILSLDLKAVYEIYDVEGREEDDSLKLRTEDNAFTESIYIGPRINYLSPAIKVVVGLCTVGSAISEAMDAYSQDEEYLLMYYLDVFAVKALGELSEKLRNRVEELAAEKGWGVGPSMQPGSVTGWEVSGQSDLFRLGKGEAIGLSVNDSHFLLPRISSSTIIGIGPDYRNVKVGSMCHECIRRETCLWRRENVKKDDV